MADAIGSALLTEYSGVIYWDLRNSFLSVDDDSTLYGWREGGDSGLLGSDNGTPPATGPFVFYPSYFGVQLASKFAIGCGALVDAASDVSELSVHSGVQKDGPSGILAGRGRQWVVARPGAVRTDIGREIAVASGSR